MLKAPELSIQELNELTQEAIKQLNNHESVAGAMTMLDVTKPGVKLEVKRRDLLQYGVTFTDVVDGMQTHFGGSFINTFNMDGRNYRVMVQNKPQYREDLDALKNVGFTKHNGQRITYDKLFTARDIRIPNFITRYNAEQSAIIDVIPSGSSGEAIAAVLEISEKLGYDVEFTGAAKEEIEAGNTVIWVMALAMLVTFLVLVAQYESWTIPLAIMLTVPTAVIGIVEA